MNEHTQALPRFKLVTTVALILLTAIFVGFGISERNSAMESGRESARQIAEHTALIADGTLDATRHLLYSMTILAKTAPAQADGTAIRNHLLQLKARSPHIMDLLMVGPQGVIRHWTGRGATPNITDREYYRYHAAQTVSTLYLGPPQSSKVHEGAWFFAMSEALRDPQGKIEYVLVALIDVEVFRKHLDVRMAVPESSQVLLTPDGDVYARTPDHKDHVGKKVSRSVEFEKLTLSTPATTLLLTSQLDGKDRIASFRRLASYPVIAGGTVPVDQLLRGWKRHLLIIAVVWVALASAIVLLAQRAHAQYHRQTELATIDSLTGMFNRRSIIARANALERSTADSGTMAIMMIDVDHFKSINDDFGHAVGDEILKRISKILRTQIRATDFVGRYGGEEFLVLMPDTGYEGALKVAEKLRSSVASSIFQPRAVSISIGIATTTAAAETGDMSPLDHTLKRADEALYKAKDAGRNCIRLADQDSWGKKEAAPLA